MRVEVAFADGRLVGGLPLETRRPFPGISVMSFMGRQHSALGDVLLADDVGASVARQLVERARDADVDYVNFFGAPETSVLGRAFTPAELPSVERIQAPVLDLAGGWDAVYREKMSARRRRVQRRRERILQEMGDVDFRLARTEDELVDALEAAFRLNDLRWKGRSDTSEFTTTTGKEFHRAAIRELACDDRARILLLLVDGVPIAFEYYLLLDDRMYRYRTGFDPTFERGSPGWLALLRAIELASSEGATRVEYLGGREQYKLDLSHRQEPLLQYIGLATTVRGSLAAQSARQGTRLRMRLSRSDRLRALYGKRYALNPGRLTRSPR